MALGLIQSVKEMSKGEGHRITGHQVSREEKRYSSTHSQPRRKVGGGVQQHALAALPPEKTGTRCTGGWVGSRAGLDV
jgi:hypothetical protein